MDFENFDIDTVYQWLAVEGVAFGINLLVFAIILLAGWILARIVSGVVDRALAHSKVEPSPILKSFVLSVTRKSIVILAFIVGLDQLGVDTAAIIAGLGASGLIIGFALKDTLSNFAAGFLLLMYRPFDVGHFVQVAGIEGTVKDLTLVSTELTTGDNKIITVPNSKVWGTTITNFTKSETRRIDLVAGIGYDDDIPKAKAILCEILAEHELVLDEPQPVVRMKELADSSVNFDVRPWVKTSDYWPVRAEILEQIKFRFDAADIGIPYPQTDVWLHEVKDTAA